MDPFWQSNWAYLYDFFAEGSPPLAIQILALNTIFFMLWMVRRMRGARALRKETAITVQVILIVANCIILFQQTFLGYTNYLAHVI